MPNISRFIIHFLNQNNTLSPSLFLTESLLGNQRVKALAHWLFTIISQKKKKNHDLNLVPITVCLLKKQEHYKLNRKEEYSYSKKNTKGKRRRLNIQKQYKIYMYT